MEAALTTLVAEILKQGVLACLAAYFYLSRESERKDRRATEQVATELLMKVKDQHHEVRMGDVTRTYEVMQANAKMIEAHTAQQAQLTAEIRELAQEVRRRPCLDGGK
ncbi:hypothetical protein B0A89_13065 [Paracoccus contaminans]|uniref:Uncharacterized protein n=2 Tax=Paracoccus contaminans TaxID=1945662 RepID=A0A1W6CZY9_9RHOB|nr:hypothetical protein B0A89_13065 [Paracoccus contaminans]